MKILDYLSYLPKVLTEKITNLLTNEGFAVSQRWTSLLFFFIVLFLGFIGFKISNKAIKWILIIVALVLTLGILIPFW